MVGSLEYPRPDEVALDRELGRELMRARLAAGLSRTDLGEAAGLSEPTLAGAEDGTARLPTSRLLRLLEHTGTDPLTALAQALAAACEPGAPKPASVILLTHHCRLSPEMQQRVRDLIATVATRA